MIVVELPAALAEKVGGQAFVHGSLAAGQIALEQFQPVLPGEHGGVEPHILHIDLEYGIDGVAFQGQPRFRQVVAPGDDARFFQPGKSPFELGRFGAFFQLGILVLLFSLFSWRGTASSTVFNLARARLFTSTNRFSS